MHGMAAREWVVILVSEDGLESRKESETTVNGFGQTAETQGHGPER